MSHRESLETTAYSPAHSAQIVLEGTADKLGATGLNEVSHRVVYGSNAIQAVRTASIMQRNRGSFRRTPRNGS